MQATPNQAAPKETKAQKVERLKLQNNPWEIFDEVRAFARQGRSAVLPEWASVYFKWWGIYTQGDGAGVTGGKGGEGVTTDYFMMRIPAPGGQLSAHQARVIGQLAKSHARNLADITVRQNLQLHWLTIESLPEVVDALDKVGLSPKGACGDVVRNVTGCPLAGVDAHELFDTSSLAASLSRHLVANSAYYNLPRKFKITVTGCPVWCSYPEINDVSFTAALRDGKEGFSVHVGGGLSKEPHLAVRLGCWVRVDQVLAVARIITELYRDQDALRESRDRARLKYLFLRHHWTAETFLAEVERRLGYALLPAVADNTPTEVLRDHIGVHPQKQDGLYYVGASVLTGRLTADQLLAVADLAERFGTGQMRATVGQNLIFLDIPKAHISALVAELAAIGLPVDGTEFWRGAVACTGTEFCKLALTETKGFTQWLVDELEESLPGFDQQLKLHVTGCPNSCGQHWIADIGLEGKKIKHEGALVDAYYFCVGGAVGQYAQIARPVGYRIPATDVPAAITRLLTTYSTKRLSTGEDLRAYFSRHSNEELRAQLAGESLDPVARDTPPPGAAPQEVA